MELAELLIDCEARLNCFKYEINANLQLTDLYLAAERGHDKFIWFIEGRIILDSIGMEHGYNVISYQNKEGNMD